MTTMTATLTDGQVRAQRFTNTLASEWSKLFSLRSTYIMLALALALSVGMTALVSLAVGSTFDDWREAERAQFEPITFSLAGSIFGRIVFAVFGVLAVTGEYSSGMMRLTLTVTPRRGRVIAAKALIVTLVMIVLGLLTTVGMFVTGQAVLGSFGMPTTSFGDSDARNAVLCVGVTTPFFPLVGLALGFLLRSTAGAITAVLAIIWLPEIFGGLLPMWWRENVLAFLPGSALDGATIGHIVESPMYRDPALSAAVAVAWLVAFLGVAYLMLARRDA